MCVEEEEESEKTTGTDEEKLKRKKEIFLKYYWNSYDYHSTVCARVW